MTRPLWDLDGDTASLRLGKLDAQLDLSRPGEGLVVSSPQGDVLAQGEVLRIGLPGLNRDCTPALVEGFARGRLLHATYGESDAWPTRAEVSWCVVSSEHLAAIDMVLSVSTQTLDSDPALVVCSRLRADEVLRLVDAECSRFSVMSVNPESASAMKTDQGPSSLLFRRTGSEYSYAEMVHPEDFRADDLSCTSDRGEGIELRHHVFADTLEKGVILRARIRGALIGRADDERLGADCYRAFVGADPPLGP